MFHSNAPMPAASCANRSLSSLSRNANSASLDLASESLKVCKTCAAGTAAIVIAVSRAHQIPIGMPGKIGGIRKPFISKSAIARELARHTIPLATTARNPRSQAAEIVMAT